MSSEPCFDLVRAAHQLHRRWGALVSTPRSPRQCAQSWAITEDAPAAACPVAVVDHQPRGGSENGMSCLKAGAKPGRRWHTWPPGFVLLSPFCGRSPTSHPLHGFNMFHGAGARTPRLPPPATAYLSPSYLDSTCHRTSGVAGSYRRVVVETNKDHDDPRRNGFCQVATASPEGPICFNEAASAREEMRVRSTPHQARFMWPLHGAAPSTVGYHHPRSYLW